MYSTRVAYLLWLPSLFGFAGLHRLYLGKFGTGVLWFMTGGLFFLGTLYDALTMREQVREARLRDRVRRALDEPEPRSIGYGAAYGDRRTEPQESPEHAILRVARANHGIATPATVALESKISTDEARRHLDTLVDKGIGEVRVRKNGTIAYVFPDFLDDAGSAELEQF